MAKKHVPKIKAEAKAIAKVEASVKASYHRKKTTTETIPPDVTRAKAGAWLDAISPITEWAGLKGDALRYRRLQLRIQQEAALDRLASLIRRKIKSKEIESPLPPKILVPALEAASLEDPTSPLIEWWANLFVAGATGSSIRPYHVDLMKVIGIEEARCLDEIWSKFATRAEYLSGEYEAGPNTCHRLIAEVELELVKLGDDALSYDQFLNKIMELLYLLHKRLEPDELPFTFTISQSESEGNDRHRLSFSFGSDLLETAPVPLEVCLALNLLKKFKRVFSLPSNISRITPREIEPEIAIEVFYPSALGVEFLNVCHPLGANEKVKGGDNAKP